MSSAKCTFTRQRSQHRSSSLFLSRWSIRRKLLVCLAIVLAIVVALAYSGFSGGYSYKKLAWTIRVRATDLKLVGELTEGLSDLRASLQNRELFPASVVQNTIRDRFFEKLRQVDQDLQQYRNNLKQNELRDTRFGDRT